MQKTHKIIITDRIYMINLSNLKFGTPNYLPFWECTPQLQVNQNTKKEYCYEQDTATIIQVTEE